MCIAASSEKATIHCGVDLGLVESLSETQSFESPAATQPFLDSSLFPTLIETLGEVCESCTFLLTIQRRRYIERRRLERVNIFSLCLEMGSNKELLLSTHSEIVQTLR